MPDVLADTSFEFDPQLTEVVNATRNEDLIHEEVYPIVRVDQETYSYLEIPEGEDFQVPETEIGPTGDPNEMVYTGRETPGKVKGHAVAAKVPRQAQAQRRRNYDPRARHAIGIRRGMDLRKELDMADRVFDPANYNAPRGYVEVFAGPAQWSDPASDPTRKVAITMDKHVMRPNIAVLGQNVSTYVRIHPRIISAFNRNQGEEGKVNLGFVADLWELDAVLVGRAWYNTNAVNLDPSLDRVWGNRMALMHRSFESVTTEQGIQVLSYGVTFVWPIDGQDMASFSWTDPKPGTRGVEWVKVSRHYDHKLVSRDFGHLFVDVVALPLP